MGQDDNSSDEMRESAASDVISLAREELRVTRRVVERGGIRVRISVSEHDETTDISLRSQDVEVERVAVGRVVEHLPETRQEGDILVIPVVEEILVVERRLVLKEEIRVRYTEQKRPVRDTVRLRREIAEVESVPPSES